MIREIQAKVLLTHIRQPDTWFGLKYSMNLYRGCQHHCIYCDSRSECYGIEDFDGEVLVKANAVELLRDELSRKRVKGPIGLGAMNDAYMPAERVIRLTRRALEVIAEMGFGVHVMTKSDLVLRDVDLLEAIARRYATVTFTITTADDHLARIVEPGAPSPSARFRAMAELAGRGIRTGVTLMPVLPFLEDTEDNITGVVERAHACGASYIIPGFGVTLRDRQREYFYARLDQHFPGVRSKYEQAFGTRYSCSPRNEKQLRRAFEDACARAGISTAIIPDNAGAAKQERLL